MLRIIAVVLVSGAVLAGCSGAAPSGRSCDDGGDGGVMIDGICL